MAIVTRTVTLRPSGYPYYGGTFYNAGDWEPVYLSDNNDSTETRRVSSTAQASYHKFLDFTIPSTALIKSVQFCILGHRYDSSSNVAYKFNLLAADNIDANTTGKTKIFAADLVPDLVRYDSQSTGGTPNLKTISQSFTAEQSQQFLSSPYPSFYMYSKGAIVYNEIYLVFTYEVDESNKIFVGTTPIKDIYVGTTKASAVYVGTTKVM